MSNLKPCPFCGISNVEAQGWGCFTVVCLDCGANGPVIPRGEMSVVEACAEVSRLWNNLFAITAFSQTKSLKDIFISADRKKFIILEGNGHHQYSWNDLPTDRSEWDSDDYQLHAILRELGIKKGNEDE